MIAAHEVGHALQDATHYGPLAARTRMVKNSRRFETIGAALMLLSPLAPLLLKVPHLMIVQLLAGLLLIGFTVAVHAVTLPVEFDASFRRAMPLLADGRLERRDLPAARQLLRAAAFTYVAAAAMSLLNIVRWVRMIRL